MRFERDYKDRVRARVGCARSRIVSRKKEVYRSRASVAYCRSLIFLRDLPDHRGQKRKSGEKETIGVRLSSIITSKEPVKRLARHRREILM